MLLPVPPHSPSLAYGPFCLALVDPPAFWAFLWFVGFCFLANQWQVSKPKDNPMNEGTDAARAAITFSFFSIFTWVSTAPAQHALSRPSQAWAAGLAASPGPPASRGPNGPLRLSSTLTHSCFLRKEAVASASEDSPLGRETLALAQSTPPVIMNAPHNTLVAGSWAFTITFSKHKQRPSREGKAL